MFSHLCLKKLFILQGCIFSLMISAPVHAGGVALGSTRVVYPASSKQISLAIRNSDKSRRYLIQSWVQDASEKKTSDFIVTPPVFVSNPNSENSLRIVYAGAPAPADRESLYWMNVKSIPAVDKQKLEGKNTLQLAVLSRIKMFVRPDGLKIPSSQAPQHINFYAKNGAVEIENTSPYYVSVINISVNGKKVPNIMVSPFNHSPLMQGPASGSVTYQTINDYGAQTPAQTKSISSAPELK